MIAHRPYFAQIDPVTKLPPSPTVDALRRVIGAPDPEMIAALVEAAVLSTQSALAGFRFDVTDDASTWIIPVPAGFGRVPVASIYLRSGEQVLADVVASESLITVLFATPTSGFVILT